MTIYEWQKIGRGTPASIGKVEGTATLLYDSSEAPSFPKGNILVARRTSQDYVLAIFAASGIVTERGGVTSHAATISREINLPCIVGCSGIMDDLKTGDYLKIDCNTGEVYRRVEIEN